jgi:hypothetical protein
MSGLPAQGYWLRPLDGVPVGPAHVLGGETRISGAVCPNCRKPLLTLLRLNAQDQRLGLQTAALTEINVLFCWTCPAAQSTIVYQLPSAGTDFRLVSFAAGPPATDFPYEGYPVSFPARALMLVALTSQEQDALSQLNAGAGVDWADSRYCDLSRPQHQIGGEPYLMQPLEQLGCPQCGGPMPLFGTVGNDTFAPEKFTDNDYVQTLVHLCRDCWIVAVYQRCD